MMNQLHKILFSLIVTALFCSFKVTAQDYAKTGDGYGIREILEFDAGHYTTLKITNQHGNITINGWDRDTIEVQTLINVQAPGSNSAEEVLRFISIERADRSGMLIFRTQFDDEFFSNFPFSIDYNISLPKKMMLQISNNLGDVLIQNIDGKINLQQDYGNMHLINSNNKLAHTFNLNFVEAKFESCNAIDGKLNNCTITADKMMQMNFKSEYSLFKIDDAKSISLNSNTDRINVNQSDSLKVTGKQLIVNCKKLNNYGFFEIDRGQLMVNSGALLSQLSISNQMANTILSLPVNYSYVINGEVTNGTINHPDKNKLQILKEGTKQSFSGIINSDNITTGQLILFNKNSDLTIKTY
ncbi:hypothetical protein [Carboxylicivirga caseinilyticus]|uniref:hypothetical protein n=1 Tax=Carboxylicivirga caseinilyticus TaxID=3417572 RepID=UPI003D34C7D8|nr:hypothetical protein [Marinilabiliaceae bacterium A049]